MSDSSIGSIEHKQPILQTGLDIFHGVIISPVKAFGMLSRSYPSAPATLLSAVLVVSVSSLTDINVGNESSSISTFGIALSILGSFIGKIIFWSVLATFLRLLAALLKQETSIGSCFVVSGWAFTPLIFRAVANCFSNAIVFGDILSCCFAAWFLLLQLFAFDSILKLGRFKTLGVVLIVPPCLFFAYFIAMIFAGAMISDGLF